MATEYSSLDMRRVAVFSGVMAAGLAADSEILQFRWASTVQKAAILEVRFSAANDGTAFAAGTALFSVMKVNTWTVDGSGGNAVTLSHPNGKLNRAISSQDIPTMRAASTAALTAGTKTEEQRVGATVAGVPAVAGQALCGDTILYADAISGLEPMILNNQEGFTIKATVPATGTWRFAASVVWVPV